MPSYPLATTGTAGGSPPSSSTSVAFLATVDFRGQQIPINTGDVTKGIKNLNFSLSAPAELGSINNFLDWLNEQFSVPFTSKDLENVIDKIPDAPAFLKSFKDAIEKIFGTSVWITVLNINVAAGTFQIGVSFPVNLQILSFLTLENIGVVVSKGGAEASP